MLSKQREQRHDQLRAARDAALVEHVQVERCGRHVLDQRHGDVVTSINGTLITGSQTIDELDVLVVGAGFAGRLFGLGGFFHAR